MTDGSAFVQLEEEFRQAFEMTVIDLPRNMLINFPHLLADVNVIVLATEMTLASARDTIRILSWLKTNAAHAHPVIVANKFSPVSWKSARPISRHRSNARSISQFPMMRKPRPTQLSWARPLRMRTVRANRAQSIRQVGEYILGPVTNRRCARFVRTVRIRKGLAQLGSVCCGFRVVRDREVDFPFDRFFEGLADLHDR